jgi:thiosulfate reductase cytochrome b subunit
MSPGLLHVEVILRRERMIPGAAAPFAARPGNKTGLKSYRSGSRRFGDQPGFKPIMSSLPTSNLQMPLAPARNSDAAKVIQPAWVRIVHWINAVAMIMMIMSGWQIYNASPLFDFTFSRSTTLGGWLGGALLWHFAAMWLLMVNGLVYLVLGFVTGRFRRKLLPLSAGGVIGDTKAALTGKLSHDDLTKYNQIQKLLYAGIIVVGVLIVLSGLSIWKPVQLQWLTALFGGYDVARYVHFFCMAAIVAFLVIHVALALLVPKSLRVMIIGR